MQTNDGHVAPSTQLHVTSQQHINGVVSSHTSSCMREEGLGCNSETKKVEVKKSFWDDFSSTKSAQRNSLNESPRNASRGFYDNFSTGRSNRHNSNYGKTRSKSPVKRLLSSDGTLGYGGSEYIGAVYNGANAPDNLKFKWDYLWVDFAKELREKLVMDDVAIFSVTALRSADAITDVLMSLEGVGPKSVVTDATACVGGNTISFIRTFEKVNAIELDPKRIQLLEHNVNAVRSYYSENNNDPNVPRIKFGDCSVLQGSCLDVCPNISQDIIFLDPPWGGRKYKRMGEIPLYLSGLTMGEVCKQLRSCTKYIALKLPLTTDVAEIARISGGEVVTEHKLAKMKVLILSYQKRIFNQSNVQNEVLDSFHSLSIQKEIRQ
mmetsp:Transcript_11483/g.13184  ORF Transcript_11483/g.13184 Transcript_11483/m.13184 type:complete len:378 (-) Transcript_11483:130-1263(-)